MFLNNCWYIAAWSRDIEHKLTTRKILSQNLVFYRQQDGNVVALEDACPHRKLPLSKGRLLGDIVECGYHGLQFDCSGKCVLAPTQDRIPPTAKVQIFPVFEKWGFVWVWMGEAGQADEKKVFEIPNFDNPQWGMTEGGNLDIQCHYLWLTDNLLDPSHVAWVHQTSFAAPGTDGVPLEQQAFDDGFVVSRWIYDQPLPPYYESLVKFDGNCDRLQHYEVRAPSICINRSIFTPAGSGGNADELPDDAYVMVSYNFMTPIDENSTTYYWLQCYNTDPDNVDIAKQINDGAVQAFNEDRDILEAVHIGMNNMASPNINLGLDAGSLHFRRTLAKAIAAEQNA
ncbi:MAG: aromatic ring-hydroxylating dioxygenase subunit alpha [Woeseia sp.]|nr:aromatic ring-hydroxylating dioxygenase subunit alpha [Woeseia sp.]